MPIHASQVTFGRGELSPRLHARTDIEHWKMGLAKCVNWLILRQGGLRRRPGTERMGDRLPGSRLIPFVFSADFAYILEFGDHVLRIWSPVYGQVTLAGAPYEISSPYGLADLKRIQYAQSNDVLFLTDGVHPQQRLSRFGETSWYFDEHKIEDGPYLKMVAGSRTTLKPSGRGSLTTGGAAYASSGNAALAFDQDDNTFWEATGIDEEYLRYDLAAPKVVTGYSLLNDKNTPPVENDPGAARIGEFSAPRTWTFEGFDGNDWVILDAQAGVVGWGAEERRYFNFNNKAAYQSYRLVVTERNDSVDQRQPVRIKEMTMVGGGAGAAVITITANNTLEINDGQGFLESDVGRSIRFFGVKQAIWSWLEIATVVSPTQVTVRVHKNALGGLQPTAQWQLGAFSATTGYPARCAFFQGRLGYARTELQKTSFWMSKVDDYEDFSMSTPLLADDAVTFTFAESGEVMFLAEAEELMFGTTSSARVIGAADKGSGFSANNFTQILASKNGFDAVQPVVIGNKAIAVGRFGKVIREVGFDAEKGGYGSPDISILSEHIFRKGIEEFAYVEDPSSIVWIRLSDGNLAALTYEDEQRMLAFTRHKLGGKGKVESIAAIPGVGRHELWLAVSRTVAGEDREWIERLSIDFEVEEDEASPEELLEQAKRQVYVDACSRYEGEAVSTVTGIDYLDGMPLQGLADGAALARLPDGVRIDAVKDEGDVPTNKTGADGEWVMPSPATVVTVGLPYKSRLRTLRSNVSAGDGAGVGRKKVLRGVTIDVLDSQGLHVRSSIEQSQEVFLRTVQNNMDEAVPLVTGSSSLINVNDSWSGEGVAEVSTIDPFAATIRAITPVIDIGG